MEHVYLLWHTHDLPGGTEDAKLIGVYESQEAAERAENRVRKLPGFADVPKGFEIDAYEIGEDQWTEGFVSVKNDSMPTSPSPGSDGVPKAKGIPLNITPLGFVRYAHHYFLSARAVPRFDGFSPVRFYLYCHSIELALKAFLLTKGVSSRKLKEKPFGHDLEAILGCANKHGLSSVARLSEEEKRAVKFSNALYERKRLEYFFVEDVVKAISGKLELPDLQTLDAIADRLTSSIGPICNDT